MNCFDDQAKMTDALNSQKFITGNYNHYAGECATKERKDKLMEILSEEHDMQFEVFCESKSGAGMSRSLRLSKRCARRANNLNKKEGSF